MNNFLILRTIFAYISETTN